MIKEKIVHSVIFLVCTAWMHCSFAQNQHGIFVKNDMFENYQTIKAKNPKTKSHNNAETKPNLPTQSPILDIMYDLQRDNPNANMVLSPNSIKQTLKALLLAQKKTPKINKPAWLKDVTNQSTDQSALPKNQQTDHKTKQTLINYNHLWYDKTEKVLPSFKTSYASALNGHLNAIDFTNSQHVAKQINSLIEKATQQRFSNIVNSDDLKNTNVVFTNSVYFKSDWQQVFKSKKTKAKTFMNANKTSIKTPMMSQINTYQTATHADWTLVILPFADNATCLNLYLPPPETPLALPNTQIRHSLMQSATAKKIQVTLPKIDISGNNISLNQLFPEIDTWQLNRLYQQASPKKITAFHQAKIKWDEQGAEAAAASIAIGSRSMTLNIAPKVMFNRPFFYTLTSHANNKNHTQHQLIFAGSVRTLNP